MSSVEKIVSLSELVAAYPFLSPWFDDPDNTAAQIKDGKRLLSVREKVEMFGGKEQVKKNLAAVPKGWRNYYTVLLACRQEPMVGFQISKFGESVGKRLYIATLYSTINDLMDQDELSRILGLTYVYRNNRMFILNEDRPGYLTTPDGLRIMALQAERKEKWFLGGLLPRPNC